MWRETLKGYSYQEFERAMNRLVSNPPKYELDDGTIQVWRGMPKLPDVIDVMLNFREKDAQAARDRESEKRAAEFRELENRRQEHPEEFFGMADLAKEIRNNAKLKALCSPDRDGAAVPCGMETAGPPSKQTATTAPKAMATPPMRGPLTEGEVEQKKAEAVALARERIGS